MPTEYSDIPMTYINEEGTPYKALLVHADPHLGFTIVNPKVGDIICCYRGDSSPQMRNSGMKPDPEADKAAWEYITSIMEGEGKPAFRYDEFMKIMGRSVLSVASEILTSADCVFSQ